MYERLQLVYLSMSRGVTIRLVNNLVEGHDDEVIEWKKSSLMEVTIRNRL